MADFYESDVSDEAEVDATAKCSSCGSTKLRSDPLVGLLCLNCSSILDSNVIVNSVQFSKQADGSSALNGQLVTHFTQTADVEQELKSSGNFAVSNNYRETSLRQAKRELQELATQLKLGPLSQTLCDKAHKLFNIALYRFFLKGRNKKHVLGACLYIAIRREKAPFFLLDISEALRIGVHKLARVFSALRKMLQIQIPPVDVLVFIEHIVASFEFEQKDEAKICQTARRILSRMRKDYIASGRKPQGVIAAAVILAGRMFGYAVDTDMAAEKLKVNTETAIERLQDFERSSSAFLTAGKFMDVDLKKKSLPPSMSVEKKKKKEDEEFYAALETSLNQGKALKMAELEQIEIDETEFDRENVVVTMEAQEESESEDESDLEGLLLTVDEQRYKTAVFNSQHKEWYKEQLERVAQRNKGGSDRKVNKRKLLDFDRYNFDDLDCERSRHANGKLSDVAKSAAKSVAGVFGKNKPMDIAKFERLLNAAVPNSVPQQ